MNSRYGHTCTKINTKAREKKMEREQLTFEDRKKLYIDACTWNKPKRVLLNAYQMGWMYTDCGMTLDVASRDYYMSEVAMDEFMKKYPVDAIGTASNGFRYHYRFTDPLGHSGGYANPEENLKEGNVNAIFEDLVTVDDFDDMMADLNKVRWEKAVFNLYPDAKNLSPEVFARAAQEVYFLNAAKEKVNTTIRDKWGVLIPYGDVVGFSLMVDNLFNIYRGIKGLSIDLRRHKDKVYELCEYFDNKNLEVAIAKLDARPNGHGVGTKNHYDCSIGALAHTTLNSKHIEKLCIEPWRKFLDKVQEKEKTVYCNIEGAFLNRVHGDFFGEYNKGTLNMTVEMDDPYEVRKAYPNIAIYGGLNVDILGNGTPQQAVDMAKKAIDELGYDGGLYLAPNKMVAYRWDMSSENIKAVSEFTSTYYLR